LKKEIGDLFYFIPHMVVFLSRMNCTSNYASFHENSN